MRAFRTAEPAVQKIRPVDPESDICEPPSMPTPEDSLDFLTLTQGEFDVPTETRVKRTLEQADSRQGSGTMQLGAINKISQARIRYAVAELTGMNLEKASKWLDEL